MDIAVVELPPQPVVIIRRQVPMAELTEFFGHAFTRLAAAIGQAGGTAVGPPFAWYHGVPTAEVDVAAGFAVDGIDDGSDLPNGSVDGAEVTTRPGGRAAVCVHLGPYDTLEVSYAEVERWMVEHDLVGRDDMWEEYLTDPGSQPDPTVWETRIVVPLA